jgi:hypothetical protein
MTHDNETHQYDYADALEDFDTADILRDKTVEAIRHALKQMSTPPPPSGDAVSIPALETAREIAKRDHPSLAKAADMYLNRALPATPVNTPSAERVIDFEALQRDLESRADEPDWDASWVVYVVKTHIDAALYAPVDTGWIDEMRNAGHSDLVMDEDYYIGYNAALDAVKQKLDGRG